jgi:hypothetical protein
MAACNIALTVDAGNKDLIKFRQQSETELQSRIKSKEDSLQRTLTELTTKWSAVWEIAETVRVSLGYPLYAMPEPREMRDLWVQVDTAPGESESTVRWPVLLQYPQYGTYDVLSAAGVEDMLVDHLAMAFPEKEDAEQRIEWDTEDEYHVSNLAVYVQLHASQRVESRVDWLEACMEQRVLLQGGNIELLHLLKRQRAVSAEVSSSKPAATSGDTVFRAGAAGAIAGAGADVTFEKLKHSVELREKGYWERMTDVATGKLVTHSGKGLTSSSVQFLEVHLGCSIGSIVKAHFPAHVLARGTLTLLVYPRQNRLHKLFVEQNKGKIVQLLP